MAFAPAEEADVNDPTYGAFARLDPGGESYYEKADETKRTAEAAAAAEALAAAVADAANDDSVDPGAEALAVTEPARDAAGEASSRRKKRHTRRWWERYAARRGGETTETSWRVFALRGAASACVVVWLTALAVSAVLKRADGRGEDERRSLL